MKMSYLKFLIAVAIGSTFGFFPVLSVVLIIVIASKALSYFLNSKAAKAENGGKSDASTSSDLSNPCTA